MLSKKVKVVFLILFEWTIVCVGTCKERVFMGSVCWRERNVWWRSEREELKESWNNKSEKERYLQFQLRSTFYLLIAGRIWTCFGIALALRLTEANIIERRVKSGAVLKTKQLVCCLTWASIWSKKRRASPRKIRRKNWIKFAPYYCTPCYKCRWGVSIFV